MSVILPRWKDPMVRTKSWMASSFTFSSIALIFWSCVISHRSLTTSGFDSCDVSPSCRSSNRSTCPKSLPRTNIFVYLDRCNSDVSKEHPIPSVPPAMNSTLGFDLVAISSTFCEANLDIAFRMWKKESKLEWERKRRPSKIFAISEKNQWESIISFIRIATELGCVFCRFAVSLIIKDQCQYEMLETIIAFGCPWGCNEEIENRFTNILVRIYAGLKMARHFYFGTQFGSFSFLQHITRIHYIVVLRPWWRVMELESVYYKTESTEIRKQ